jgi:CPA1 family monovalent cation:H+ antiporter
VEIAAGAGAPGAAPPPTAARVPEFSPVVLAIAFAAVVVALTALARRLPVPPPILQVAAGVAVGLAPGVRIPELEPEVVFFVFLPPTLWAAAFFTSRREFRANLRPIGLLAVGLVLATTAAVAAAARALLPGIPWAAAVALGAIVSPPDAVAAAAIVSRLPVPRRVVVILEGESLVNDASALVLYRTAVAAAVTGAFSWGESVVRFFVDAGVGTLVGLLVGWLIVRALRSTRDPLAETLLTLAGPYVAWVAAEALHASAVLACVAGGLYLRQHLSTAVGAASRLQARSVWDLVVFLLNALIFLLLGVEFARLLPTVPGPVLWPVLRAGAVVGLVAIAVRPGVGAGGHRGAAGAERGRPPARPAARLAPGVPRGVDQHARHRVAGLRARAAARGRVGRAVPVPHRDPAGHDGRDPDGRSWRRG